jgi:hypothetical protein
VISFTFISVINECFILCCPNVVLETTRSAEYFVTWLAYPESPPTNMTESHFYAALPELLDYFFLRTFDRLMTLCLGFGPPAVKVQTCLSQVGTSWQRD